MLKPDSRLQSTYSIHAKLEDSYWHPVPKVWPIIDKHLVLILSTSDL